MKKIDLAKSIAAQLSSIAQSRGLPYQLIATTFLLERLLARLVLDSRLAKSLVFKGGYVGLRVYESPRYTIDLDALLLKAGVAETLKRTVAAGQKDINDGAWFLFESQVELKTQGEYGGVRQVFRAGLGEPPRDVRRTQTINFDLGIGDPVTPGPIKTKTSELLGDGELAWQVYPVETIVAEKLHTLVDRGGNSSRSKDVYDLHYYIPLANSKLMQTAIERCFAFRGTPVPSDMASFLSKIDLALLKRGWKSAIASLKDAPNFDEAFNVIVKEVEKHFSGAPGHRRRGTK